MYDYKKHSFFFL